MYPPNSQKGTPAQGLRPYWRDEFWRELAREPAEILRAGFSGIIFDEAAEMTEEIWENVDFTTKKGFLRK